MLELVGQKLDHFQVTGYMGQNRACAAYKAYDLKSGRHVVIEILYIDNTGEPSTLSIDIKEQFLQAARATLGWRNPGIARIIDYGQIDVSKGSLIIEHSVDVKHPKAAPYLVREYIPGANLRQLLQDMISDRKWLGLTEAIQLTRQIGLALDYAHQRGIWHGDLNPENILLKSETAEDLPYQTVLVGTGYVGLIGINVSDDDPIVQAYIPPEQIRGKKIGVQGDIYAMGVLLYELVVSQLPQEYESNSKRGVKQYAEQSPLPSPRLLRPDLPVPVERVIQKALAENPEDRFVDVRFMVRALTETLPEVQQVKTTPPGINEAVSLFDAYRHSLIKPNGEQDFPHRSSNEHYPTELGSLDITQDLIHILEPDQTVHSVHMKIEGLTIGRGTENDITIEHPGVSRYHARLDFDGENYIVRDLNSMNGTYLEDLRLQPDTPKVWLPGENLRVGGTWLRLERAEQAQSTVASEIKSSASKVSKVTEVMLVHPDGSEIDPSQLKYSPGAGLVGIFIETPNLSVNPGRRVVATILLINLSQVPDIFKISLSGIPTDWILDQQLEINIPPKVQKEVRLTFQPPRSPESRAGRHPVTVRVSSQQSSDQIAESKITLTVTAFSQFTSELRPSYTPKNLRAGEMLQVVINNMGNLPETFKLTWEDRYKELSFDPPQAKITIPQGKSAGTDFRAFPIRPRLFGKEKVHTFTAQVHSPTGEMQSLTGEVVSRGLIPPWTLAVLASTCIFLTCIVFLLYYQISNPSRYAQQTAQANQTALAQSIQATTLSETSTAGAPATAMQATAQAATATTAWSAADDDNDGLPNSQEMQLGTDSIVADTDIDGLNDGEEVNTWKTNPLDPDTDGDGLKDGEEISRGINPLKKDTDGDGIEDTVDPDPGRASSATPLPSPTSTTTAIPWTPTFTHTPTPGTLPVSADLSISISNDRSSSVPGTIVVYTIAATNKGPDIVTNAKILDSFPDILFNISWTCNASPGSRCGDSSGEGNIDTTIDLPVGGSATFTVNGTISSGATGLLANTASLNTPPGVTELNTVDNLATDTDTLTPKVALSITKSDGQDEAKPGQITSYTIAVTNNGPSAVTGVSIIDTFPDIVTDITWACNASTGSSCASGGIQNGDINTTIDLMPGGTASITANGTIRQDATGPIVNTAFLSSPIDPVTNNQSATDTTEVISSQADLIVNVIAPTSVITNTVLTYTLEIVNNGPSDATDVTLTDILPPEVQFASSDPVCFESAGTATCNLDTLVAGANTQVNIVVNTPAVTGTITNQANVSAIEPDPNLSNNQVTTVIQIE